MKIRGLVFAGAACMVVLSFLLSGCAVNLYKQSPRSAQTIKDLQSKVDELESQRLKEQIKFEEVKKMLERKLKGQIADESVTVEMSDGGIAIVLSDSILFDSGKAQLKKDALPVLDQVADIVKREVPDKNVGIGGHTDNVPIQYSTWKTNWELSSARATNVLYYLEEKGVSPKRLSATGYGEYRPIAANDTAKGRSVNRRVEIIILPEFSKEKSVSSKKPALK